MNRKFKFLIVIYVLLSTSLFSQKNSISITAAYGVNKLMADIPSKLGGGGGMGFYYTPINNLDAGFSFNIGAFSGSDNSYIYKNATGVQFLTNCLEINLKAKYNLYGLKDPNPYTKIALNVIAGIGFIDFRDKLEDLNGNYLAGYGYENATKVKKKATTEIYIPLGLGIKYRIDKHYSLAFEPTFNWCNTDKLDFVKDGKRDHFLFFPIVFEYRIYPKNVE